MRIGRVRGKTRCCERYCHDLSSLFSEIMDLLQTFCYIFIFCISLGSIDCYFISIDAHAEECYFDKVTSGTKMSLMFEVAEGGFLDIDVKVGI